MMKMGEYFRNLWNERIDAPPTFDLVSMLSAVRSVGSEARWLPFGGSVKAAPVLIGEMAVAGG